MYIIPYLSTHAQPISQILLSPQWRNTNRSPSVVLVPTGSIGHLSLTMSYNFPYTHHSYANSNFPQSYQSSSTLYPLSQGSATAYYNNNNDYSTLDYPTSDSPDSLDSICSLPEESLYASYASEFTSPLSPTPTRADTYPPSSTQRLRNSAVRPAETHTIHRNENEMEDIIREKVHKMSEMDRRSLNLPPGRERPNFYCQLPGCMQPWIYTKTQVKEHLTMQHKINFRKPWGCSCGSQFGRQVEADRHLEDQKPCSSCGLPGRKLKGFGGMICHRCQKRGISKRPLDSPQ